jgi:predicted ribosomally synthesized peptide with nif11-like leader
MSVEAVETFRKEINGSPELQAALRACVVRNGEIDPETVVGLGHENGFDFTAAELEAVLGGDELSDFELELVAAGGGIKSNGHKKAF